MHILSKELHSITFLTTIIRYRRYIRPILTAQAIRLDSDDDDVYLEYYSGKGFHINYSCLHVLRKTHELVQ
jgi:hypothetical protein